MFAINEILKFWRRAALTHYKQGCLTFSQYESTLRLDLATASRRFLDSVLCPPTSYGDSLTGLG
eukprot:scaffold240512_cov25-Prasinocladus_malaysianus.AAC.1